jgi:hypothetical protein
VNAEELASKVKSINYNLSPFDIDKRNGLFAYGTEDEGDFASTRAYQLQKTSVDFDEIWYCGVYTESGRAI